jgi:hypothetical protein
LAAGAYCLFRADLQIESRLARLEAEQARLERQLARSHAGDAQDHPATDRLSSVPAPGPERSPAPAKTLVAPPGGRSIQLELDLPDTRPFESYQVVLRTAGGIEVPIPGGLGPRRPNPQGPVLLELPSRRLQPGDYVLQLKGVAGSGKLEDLGTYSFRVVRR